MDISVVICICTYQRPLELARALAALERLESPSAPDAALHVVVVDNSPDASAAETVASWARASRYGSSFIREPRKGLSRARNAALDAALETGAEFLAFLDDDETPSRHWLEELLRGLREAGAEAAVGPVIPVFAHAPPGWAAEGGFHACGLVPGEPFVREGRTNNVIVRCDLLRRSGTRFEAGFDEVGGEDTAFFRSLSARGARIAAAPGAIVYDWIPAGRISLPWLSRRWFRTGGVEALLVPRGHASLAGRATNLGRGAARVSAGSALALMRACAGGWRDPSRIVARFETICRGGGMLAGALGWNYREYAGRRGSKTDAG